MKHESRKMDRSVDAPFQARAWFHGRCLRLLGLLSVILVCSTSNVLRAETFSEEEVRAVYLYNLAVFVEWPASAFESSSVPFRYCLLGSQALRFSLTRVLSGEAVEGHALKLVEAETPEAWRHCHLLYLGGAAPGRVSRVLKAVAGAPVLTVSDSDTFAIGGGMVGLVRQAGRLRTIINREAAERVGIQISSKLLRLATLVSSSAGTRLP